MGTYPSLNMTKLYNRYRNLQACPWDTFFCPIPWQFVTVPSRVVNGVHFEARTRHLFLKPDLAWKPKLRSESRYAQLWCIKKRSVRV